MTTAKTYLQQTKSRLEYAHSDLDDSATFVSEDKTTILTIDGERWSDMGKPTGLIATIDPLRKTRTDEETT